MRQKHLSPTHRRLGYPIWVDEAKEPATLIDAVSILYEIANAHLAVKQIRFGNTPRQHKMRTKHNNRFKTHLDIRSHALFIRPCRTDYSSDDQVDATTYLARRAGRP